MSEMRNGACVTSPAHDLGSDLRIIACWYNRQMHDAMSWAKSRGPFPSAWCRFKNSERQMMQWAEWRREHHSLLHGVDLKTMRDRWCNELSEEERTIPPAWCRFKNSKRTRRRHTRSPRKVQSTSRQAEGLGELFEIAATEEGNMLVVVPVA